MAEPAYLSGMKSDLEKSPLVLAIDTAGPRLQLALANADNVEAFVEDIARGHAEIIFDRIAKLLAANKAEYQDLTRIAVTSGPGSFTGLRIGLSAARGLALGLQIPVIGVPTLTAMSLSGSTTTPTLVVVDARRGEAYCQVFDGPARPQTSAEVLPIDRARARLPQGGVLYEPDCADIVVLARFALDADPASYPPDPTYIRAADAKPQAKAKVSRTGISVS